MALINLPTDAVPASVHQFRLAGLEHVPSMANARHAAHAHAHGQDTAVAAPEPAATAVSKTCSEA